VSKPRAHHYLPVFYLRGFTSETPKDKGFVWVYEKAKTPRRSKPENEAHERDLYAFEDEEGERHDHLEQLLSDIESAVAPLFRAIEDGYHEFHPVDWEGLTYFMALMWLRGPTGRDFVNGLYEDSTEFALKKQAENAEEFAKFYQRFLESSGTKTKVTAEELRDFILGGKGTIEQKNYGFTLKLMFDGVPRISSILKKKRWTVLISKDDQFFCTSDHPLLTYLPDRPGRPGGGSIGTGFEWPGVEIYFPLNRRQCLVLGNRARNNARQIPGGHVRETNKFMMVGARRFLYAAEKNLAMERLFNKIGCKSVPGKTAFMREPPPGGGEYVYHRR
jgi:hypothetical protein